MTKLTKSWRQTAKSFIIAFNDLGVSLVDTAKAGVDMAVEWAKKDNPHVQAEGVEIPEEDAVQPEQTEAPQEEAEAQPAEVAAE